MVGGEISNHVYSRLNQRLDYIASWKINNGKRLMKPEFLALFTLLMLFFFLNLQNMYEEMENNKREKNIYQSFSSDDFYSDRQLAFNTLIL